MKMKTSHILFFFDKPDYWDDDEDGIWKAPKVPNPAYKGPWKRKVCEFKFKCIRATENA